MNNIINSFLNSIRDNSEIIINAFIMFIGVFENFLSNAIKKSSKVIGIIVIFTIFNIITCFAYGITDVFWWTLAFTIIYLISCLILIFKSEIVTRNRIDKIIRKFTDRADPNMPICIFGGDLDFFGDVRTDYKSVSKLIKPNRIIELNKQYNQIKKMGFKEVDILSLKPNTDSERDKKTRIRIGFLKEKFGSNLEIKFFENKECSNCGESNTCLACDVCKNCSKEQKCKKNNANLCDKLKNNFQSRCFNPDTLLRGRIATKKSDGSPYAAIVTTHKSGKKYILKEYMSNTKECTIYKNIWCVWWKKCKEDKDFIDKCVKEYKDFFEQSEQVGE